MEASPATPLTIIMVEDNPVDIYLSRWVLKAHELSFELQVIDNGDHAMDYVNQLAHEERRRSPIIMLLDLNLPPAGWERDFATGQVYPGRVGRPRSGRDQLYNSH